MLDVISVLALLAMVGLAVAYTNGADRLKGPRP